MGQGRRHLLESEPNLIEDFATIVRDVYYPTKAAEALKIHPQTAFRWLKEGEVHIKTHFSPEYGTSDCGEQCTTKEVALRAFYEAIKKAQAEFSRENMQNIKSHTKKNWVAAAWLQERTQPNEFGLKTRMEHTGQGGGPIVHKLLSPEQRQRALKAANDANLIEMKRLSSGTYSSVPEPATMDSDTEE